MGPLKLEEVARLAARVDAGAPVETELPPTLPVHEWLAARAKVEEELARAKERDDLHAPIAYAVAYEAEKRLYAAERASPVVTPPPRRPEPRRPAKKKRLARPDQPKPVVAPERSAAQLSSRAAFDPVPTSRSDLAEPAATPQPPARAPEPSPAHARPVSVSLEHDAPPASAPPSTAPPELLHARLDSNATLDLASLQGAIAAAEARRAALPFAGAQAQPPARRATPGVGLPFAAAAPATEPPRRDALPFQGAPPSSPPLRAPSSPPSPAAGASRPREDLGSTMVGGAGGAALPFDRPPPGKPSEELGTLERYAELCAALQTAGTSGGGSSAVEAVFARFGLADGAKRKHYDAAWKARLGASPDEYAAWQKAYWQFLQRR